MFTACCAIRSALPFSAAKRRGSGCWITFRARVSTIQKKQEISLHFADIRTIPTHPPTAKHSLFRIRARRVDASLIYHTGTGFVSCCRRFYIPPSSVQRSFSVNGLLAFLQCSKCATDRIQRTVIAEMRGTFF